MDTPEDRRPPKEWWDRCVGSCERHEIADDCSAFCGWLWYHGEEEGSPYREAREAFFHKLDDEEEAAGEWELVPYERICYGGPAPDCDVVVTEEGLRIRRR